MSLFGPLKRYRIVVETFEPGLPYPIVVHTFQGRDKAQAEAFLAAHKKSDAFFRDCYRGAYGRVQCRNRRVREGWA